MSSTTNNNTSATSLPQGFSVFQPALGSQLQFFPAVGTAELDEMIHNFIPGSSSIQEKRATVSLDFLDHHEATGQNFKFYPVWSMGVSTPLDSPLTDAASSFFNVSPVTPNWDWSQVSGPTSSQSSIKSRQSRRGSPSSRQQTADFSHLPGMKIMTKDGMDVTNQASRGSKTKEQRDHAHLMRIIKACDSCKRKKIRCDPSHKKRSVASTSTSQPEQYAPNRPSKPSKRARAAAEKQPSVEPAVIMDEMVPSMSLDLGEDLKVFSNGGEPWEEFVQYAPFEEVPADYNFFTDPLGYFSPMDLSFSNSASSSSPEMTMPLADNMTRESDSLSQLYYARSELLDTVSTDGSTIPSTSVTATASPVSTPTSLSSSPDKPTPALDSPTASERVVLSQSDVLRQSIGESSLPEAPGLVPLGSTLQRLENSPLYVASQGRIDWSSPDAPVMLPHSLIPSGSVGATPLPQRQLPPTVPAMDQSMSVADENHKSSLASSQSTLGVDVYHKPSASQALSPSPRQDVNIQDQYNDDESLSGDTSIRRDVLSTDDLIRKRDVRSNSVAKPGLTTEATHKGKPSTGSSEPLHTERTSVSTQGSTISESDVLSWDPANDKTAQLAVMAWAMSVCLAVIGEIAASAYTDYATRDDAMPHSTPTFTGADSAVSITRGSSIRVPLIDMPIMFQQAIVAG